MALNIAIFKLFILNNPIFDELITHYNFLDIDYREQINSKVAPMSTISEG